MLSTFFCKSVEPDFKKSGKGDSHVHGALRARLRHKVFYNWFPKKYSNIQWYFGKHCTCLGVVPSLLFSGQLHIDWLLLVNSNLSYWYEQLDYTGHVVQLMN